MDNFLSFAIRQLLRMNVGLGWPCLRFHRFYSSRLRIGPGLGLDEADTGWNRPDPSLAEKNLGWDEPDSGRAEGNSGGEQSGPSRIGRCSGWVASDTGWTGRGPG